VAAAMSALVEVDTRVAFLFADAGGMLLIINNATSAKRRTAFTQMDRATWRRRLSRLIKVD